MEEKTGCTISGVGCLVMLLIIGIVFMFLGKGFKSIEKTWTEEATKLNASVGKRIVLDKDTLTIVDYSTIESTYTLSNGTKVLSTVVENTNLIK